MSKEEDILPVGKIVGLHGIKGEVKVYPYGDPAELASIEWAALKDVYLAGKEGRRACRVKRVRQGKGTLLFEMEGYTGRETSVELVGSEIMVPRSELPGLSEGEYYYGDLIGMDVWTDEALYLGRITGIMPTGGNDVFEVDGPSGEVLIPAIENTIVKMDTVGRKLIVHLLHGLLPEKKNGK